MSKAPAPGHKSIFDDLEEIRKRREELFPPERKYEDTLIDTPEEKPAEDPADVRTGSERLTYKQLVSMWRMLHATGSVS